MKYFGLVFLMVLTTVHASAQNACSRFTSGLDGWRTNSAVCTNAGGAIDCVDRSGPSNITAPAGFHGNWIANGCSRLCFDVRLIRPGATTPYFRISNGTDFATFTTSGLTAGNGWRRFCAPVAATQSGVPPQSTNGTWTLGPGSNWNALITNVTSLQFAIDLPGGGVENLRFDNICLRPTACPRADFTATTSCSGQPTHFTDLSSLAGEWRWTFGNSGVPPSTLQFPSVVLPAGVHDVTLCINSSTEPLCVTRSVRVDPGPAAPELTAQSACGPPGRYCLPPVAGVTYAWTGTNVQIAPIDAQCVRVAATGAPATLTATATDTRGCSTSTTVALEPCPTASCCAEPPFRVVGRKVISSPYTDDLGLEITIDVTAPYRAVMLTLVSSEFRYDRPKDCNGGGATQAYFTDPRPLHGTEASPGLPFPREITWLYGGPQTLLPLAATITASPPDTAGGCTNEIDLCFRVTVVLADGTPCERLVCYTLRRDFTGHTLFP